MSRSEISAASSWLGNSTREPPSFARPAQRDQRAELIDKTGGNRYPAIEFENGSVYREESAEMEKTIRAGNLFEKSGSGTPA